MLIFSWGHELCGLQKNNNKWTNSQQYRNISISTQTTPWWDKEFGVDKTVLMVMEKIFLKKLEIKVVRRDLKASKVATVRREGRRDFQTEGQEKEKGCLPVCCLEQKDGQDRKTERPTDVSCDHRLGGNHSGKMWLQAANIMTKCLDGVSSEMKRSCCSRGWPPAVPPGGDQMPRPPRPGGHRMDRFDLGDGSLVTLLWEKLHSPGLTSVE